MIQEPLSKLVRGYSTNVLYTKQYMVPRIEKNFIAILNFILFVLLLCCMQVLFHNCNNLHDVRCELLQYKQVLSIEQSNITRHSQLLSKGKVWKTKLYTRLIRAINDKFDQFQNICPQILYYLFLANIVWSAYSTVQYCHSICSSVYG